MKTKKGEKEKLRIKILEKAIAYFKVHGTGGAAIADLMKHAGQTTGALYSHFESKDDLFAQAIYHELEKLEFQVFQIFRREGKHALQAMIEQYFAEDTFLEIGDGCVFTSLSTDMQRAAPSTASDLKTTSSASTSFSPAPYMSSFRRSPKRSATKRPCSSIRVWSERC